MLVALLGAPATSHILEPTSDTRQGTLAGFLTITNPADIDKECERLRPQLTSTIDELQASVTVCMTAPHRSELEAHETRITRLENQLTKLPEEIQREVAKAREVAKEAAEEAAREVAKAREAAREAAKEAAEEPARAMKEIAELQGVVQNTWDSPNNSTALPPPPPL